MTPEVRAQLAEEAAKAQHESGVRASAVDGLVKRQWDDLSEANPEKQAMRRIAHRMVDAILSATDKHGERLVVGRDELEQVGSIDHDTGDLLPEPPFFPDDVPVFRFSSSTNRGEP